MENGFTVPAGFSWPSIQEYQAECLIVLVSRILYEVELPNAVKHKKTSYNMI